MYLVTLKLDETNVRGCRRLQSSSVREEYITHSAGGWYDVRVVADSEEDAITRAKQSLAKYKNVKVEDFFENTSRPRVWSLDLFLVCPECQKQYRGWQTIMDLEYYVCPHCRRRCQFEEDENKTVSREFTQRLNAIFSKSG